MIEETATCLLSNLLWVSRGQFGIDGEAVPRRVLGKSPNEGPPMGPSSTRRGDWNMAEGAVAAPAGALWIVNDSDLELSLTCGSLAFVAYLAGEEDYEPFSWLPIPDTADTSRASINSELRLRG